ncbi:MAG: hypothetical protein ACOCUU_00390 [Nanoarchaeota archaeon]
MKELRRIYNRNDLERLLNIGKIAEESANEILNDSYTEFNKQSLPFDEEITDRKQKGDEFLYVVNQRIVSMCLGKEYIYKSFGGNDITPIRIEFYDNERDSWRYSDKLYFAFQDFIKDFGKNLKQRWKEDVRIEKEKKRFIEEFP